MRHSHSGTAPGCTRGWRRRARSPACEACGQCVSLDPSELEGVRSACASGRAQGRVHALPARGLCAYCARARVPRWRVTRNARPQRLPEPTVAAVLAVARAGRPAVPLRVARPNARRRTRPLLGVVGAPCSRRRCSTSRSPGHERPLLGATLAACCSGPGGLPGDGRGGHRSRRWPSPTAESPRSARTSCQDGTGLALARRVPRAGHDNPNNAARSIPYRRATSLGVPCALAARDGGSAGHGSSSPSRARFARHGAAARCSACTH